ncbi:MAG TPA: Gfo/Idh/MocA family oxidoreductase [Planctomycetes bacterium]|nr:Gfo/Idh/MocA family oxidoreductase [Planctomycetota bacterium]
MRREQGNRCSRRRFVRSTGALLAAAPYAITSSALGAGGAVPASERIAVAFIGLGGHGIGRNLQMFLYQNDAEPVALCDVDRRRVDRALKVVRRRRGERFRCQITRDWREVIARRDVDAVMISTPDHWHVPLSLAAIRSGKDVICEKPTLTIAEGRVLADAVRRYGAVFQTSTEDRSVDIYHRMAELVRNGRIGKLRRIFVQLPAGPDQPGDPRPKPVPEGLDWDMWLGPAPWKPYREGLHQFHWRWNRDYSGGQLTDWGAHQLDTAQWANDTERTGPIEVEGVGKRHETGLYDTFYEYHLVYRYADGVVMHVDSGGTGLRFEGTDGWVGNDSWRAPLKASSPEILRSVIGPEEIHLYTCPEGEHRNFLDCVKSRRDPYFPAEVGHRCSTISHMGNIAMELGRKLRWDPQTETFLDDDTANRMRGRASREPWRI